MKSGAELSRDELNSLQYPVVVEMWKQSRSGKGKRAFETEFNENERIEALHWMREFYKWHLVEGTPEKKLFTLIY